MKCQLIIWNQQCNSNVPEFANNYYTTWCGFPWYMLIYCFILFFAAMILSLLFPYFSETIRSAWLSPCLLHGNMILTPWALWAHTNKMLTENLTIVDSCRQSGLSTKPLLWSRYRPGSVIAHDIIIISPWNVWSCYSESPSLEDNPSDKQQFCASCCMYNVTKLCANYCCPCQPTAKTNAWQSDHQVYRTNMGPSCC